MITPTFKLNDGNAIPVIGFGTFQIPSDGSTYDAVKMALDAGYRHIDTAQAYFNESKVGKAIKDSGIPRDQIWVTSKLWLQYYDYDTATKTIERTLQKMGLDYLDLYLLHQPYGKLTEAWQALEDAQKAGKLHSIGVSNMTPKMWKKFVPGFNVTPVVNQVEFNPYFQQKELCKLLADDDVRLEAWALLGQGNADLMHEPVITKLAEKYNKNAGQVILRFENQEGIVFFPKSVHEARIKSNSDIFDFELTPDEIEEIRDLDKGKGIHDPDAPGVGDALLNAYDVHAND